MTKPLKAESVCIWAICDLCRREITSTCPTFYAYSIPHCSNHCRLSNYDKIVKIQKHYYGK